MGLNEQGAPEDRGTTRDARRRAPREGAPKGMAHGGALHRGAHKGGTEEQGHHTGRTAPCSQRRSTKGERRTGCTARGSGFSGSDTNTLSWVLRHCSIGVGLGLKAQAPSSVDGPQPQQQPAGRAPGDGAWRAPFSGLSSWLSGATGSRSYGLCRPKRGAGSAPPCGAGNFCLSAMASPHRH